MCKEEELHPLRCLGQKLSTTRIFKIATKWYDVLRSATKCYEVLRDAYEMAEMIRLHEILNNLRNVVEIEFKTTCALPWSDLPSQDRKIEKNNVYVPPCTNMKVACSATDVNKYVDN